MNSTNIPRGFLIRNEYEVVKQLGSGFYTSVYLTRSVKNGNMYALKLYKGPYESDLFFAKRFQREFSLLHNINHPNLINYISDGMLGNTPYLVMEYVHGKTVRELISYHGRVPVAVALRVYNDVLLGLGVLHDNEIIHRDIKPSAIFVDNRGNVKLADFDIARKITEKEIITKKGEKIGSPLYMSPEQSMGRELDIRSDIFSSGITLYEMITGTPPWKNNDDFFSENNYWLHPNPPSKMVKDAGKGIDNLVLKALERNPQARYQTVKEFQNEMKRFSWVSKSDLIQWVGGRKISEADIQQAKDKNKTKIWIILLVVIVLLAIIMITILLLNLTGGIQGLPTPIPTT
jgi:serine/threonine-protein kinase